MTPQHWMVAGLLVTLFAGLVALWYGNIVLMIACVLLAMVFGSLLEAMG